MLVDADDIGSGCLLVSYLRCFDDTAQLMLDYSSIAIPAADDGNDVATGNASVSVNIQLLKGVLSVITVYFCSYKLAAFSECCHV